MVQLRSQRSSGSSSSDVASSEDPSTYKLVAPETDKSYNRKILLCTEGTLKQSLAAKLLPHPRTKAPTLYYGVGSSDTLCEITKIGQEKRSFFHGETVSSDGDIIAFSPINPVFLALPYLLENADGNFVPLDQLLPDNMADLLNNKTLQMGINKVTDWKDICDTTVHRYNKDKMLSWLDGKFDKIQEHIKTNKLISDMVMEDADAFKRVSFQLLQEYLPDTIMNMAKEHFKIKDLEILPITNKRSAQVDDMQEFATTVQEPPKKQAAKVSAAQKQLKQASKGTKSLKSFFAVKSVPK